MSLLTIGSIENLFKIYKNNLVENNILPFLNAKDRICLRWTSKTLSNIISKIQYKYFPNGRLDFIEGKIEMRLPHEIFPDEKINFGFTDVFATKKFLLVFNLCWGKRKWYRRYLDPSIFCDYSS